MQNVGNQNGLIVVPRIVNQNGNGNGNGNGVAVRTGNNEIEEVNASCILMANLKKSSTSGTHGDKAPVYDSDGSAEVHQYENCYHNEIFNMFAQEEQYTELLESTIDTHMVQQDDSNVIHVDSDMDPIIGELKQHPATIEETRAFY
ncbi:hypothetical protein Tco_1525370 [Tanacetum coccineum]